MKNEILYIVCRVLSILSNFTLYIGKFISNTALKIMDFMDLNEPKT